MSELELSSSNVLSLFETNKEQRSSFVLSIVEGLESGLIDPLKVHTQIKCMEDIISQLTTTDEKKNKNVAAAKLYKSHLLEAASRHGKSFEYMNATFKEQEVGVKYDWSTCQDQILNDLLAEQNAIDAKVKERQAFLKTVPSSGIMVVDESTGEASTVYPPSKSSTTSLIVTLK